MGKRERLVVLIEPELREELSETSRERGESVAVVVRRAIREYLRSESRPGSDFHLQPSGPKHVPGR